MIQSKLFTWYIINIYIIYNLTIIELLVLRKQQKNFGTRATFNEDVYGLTVIYIMTLM